MIPQIPEWILKLVVALAVVGVLAIGSGIITGLLWLVAHIRFVP